MPARVHRFTLRATFGPAEVFKALRHVCDHPNQRDDDPQFAFDWMARRLELSTTSAEATAKCLGHFRDFVARLGGPAAGFLAGKPIERDGRHVQPIGVALHDAATFGELIGKSLVEIGLRGVRVTDTNGECHIDVRQGAIPAAFDYAALVMQFPVPAYITISDEGSIEDPVKAKA